MWEAFTSYNSNALVAKGWQLYQADSVACREVYMCSRQKEASGGINQVGRYHMCCVSTFMWKVAT